MAIRGVNLSEKEDYILLDDPGHEDHAEYKKAIKEDREPEKPTVFHIGNLTQADRIEVGDMGTSPSMKDGEIKMTAQRVRRAYLICQRGLVGWSNFLDGNGAIIPFEQETQRTASGGFRKVASEGCLAHLTKSMVIELSGAILDKNGMRNEIEKKFDGVSQQPDDLFSGIGDAPNVPQTSGVNVVAPPPLSENSGDQSIGNSQTETDKTSVPEGT
jgi:hypothetical protein